MRLPDLAVCFKMLSSFLRGIPVCSASSRVLGGIFPDFLRIGLIFAKNSLSSVLNEALWFGQCIKVPVSFKRFFPIRICRMLWKNR